MDKEVWHNIDWLELRGIRYYLMGPSTQVSNRIVLVMWDNTATVAYDNKQEGTRSTAKLWESSILCSWTENSLLSLWVFHIKGELNTGTLTEQTEDRSGGTQKSLTHAPKNQCMLIEINVPWIKPYVYKDGEGDLHRSKKRIELCVYQMGCAVWLHQLPSPRSAPAAQTLLFFKSQAH